MVEEKKEMRTKEKGGGDKRETRRRSRTVGKEGGVDH